MSRVRLEDIAKILNVSKVTVSKALRDYPDISEEMKKKVHKIAQEVGYTPNFIARNLSAHKTNTIGLVIPDVSNLYFSHIIHGIIDYASECNYQIILTVSRENEEIEKNNILTLISMRVDGLLISISQNAQNLNIIEMVKHADIPLVFFDRHIENADYHVVEEDNFGGAFKATEYIIEQGYTRVAHLAGSLKTSIGRARKAGYEAALEKNNLPIRDEYIYECGFSKEGGFAGMNQLLSLSDPPEAVFTVCGPVSVGAYDSAKEHNIKIPQDIGIVGFGFSEFTNLLTPPLTIMSEQPKILGQSAVELLVKTIDNPSAKVQHIIQPLNLEVHGSIIPKQ